MSELIDETTQAGDPPAPAPDPAAAPAAETTPEPAPAAPAAPAPAPAVNWDDPVLLQEAADRIAALGYTIMEPQAAPAGNDPQPLEFDPFDPDSVKAYIQAQLEQERQQLLAEVSPIQQHIAEQVRTEQEQGLADTIAQIRDEAGYKAPGDDPAALDGQIRGLAEHLFQQEAGKLPPPRTPLEAMQTQQALRNIGEQSVKNAVSWFADHDKAVAEAGVAAYLGSLTSGGSHLLDPPVHGAGLPREGAPRTEAEAAAAFLARRTAPAA